MKSTKGKRATNNTHQEVKPPSVARLFLEFNTHQNITLQCRFIYIEDVKTAINKTPSKKG